MNADATMNRRAITVAALVFVTGLAAVILNLPGCSFPAEGMPGDPDHYRPPKPGGFPLDASTSDDGLSTSSDDDPSAGTGHAAGSETPDDSGDASDEGTEGSSSPSDDGSSSEDAGASSSTGEPASCDVLECGSDACVMCCALLGSGDTCTDNHCDCA